MRIVVATAQHLFTDGAGHAEDPRAEPLCAALRAQGHLAERVRIPFHAAPAEAIVPQLVACRLLDLSDSSGSPIDRLVALDFPATLIPHPHRIAWLDHPFGDAYARWDGRAGALFHAAGGEVAMEVIRRADAAVLPGSAQVFTTSRALSEALMRDCAVESTPLYAPPPDGQATATVETDAVFASADTPLVRAALGLTRQPVRVTADPAANPVAVLLQDGEGAGPALRAMQAGRCVIACGSDAAPELVQDRATGLVCRPIAAALAETLDTVWADRALAGRLGRAGLDRFGALNLSWQAVATCLTA